MILDSFLFFSTNDDDTGFMLQNSVSVEERRNFQSGEFMEIDAVEAKGSRWFSGDIWTRLGGRMIIKTSGGQVFG